MFRAELFSELCKRARDDEVFNGEPVFSKEEVYQKIAPLCYATPEQVKSWTLKNSKGPRDLVQLEKLEEIFGEELVDRNGKYPIKKYSELTQKAILSIYSIMCDFFLYDEEREEFWWKVMDSMEKSRLIIPKEEYEKIEQYLRDNLEEMVFDKEKVFPELFSEEFGVYNEKGQFRIHYEKSKEFQDKYREIENQKEDAFKEFMMKNFAEYF